MAVICSISTGFTVKVASFETMVAGKMPELAAVLELSRDRRGPAVVTVAQKWFDGVAKYKGPNSHTRKASVPLFTGAFPFFKNTLAADFAFFRRPIYGVAWLSGDLSWRCFYCSQGA